MRIVYVTVLLCLISGCGGTKESRNHCDPSISHTLLTHKNYSIYIQNPDDVKNPTIWEGPICIDSDTRDEPCTFEESLISGVETDSNTDTIHITTFSGSESWQWKLELTSCQASKLE